MSNTSTVTPNRFDCSRDGCLVKTCPYNCSWKQATELGHVVVNPDGTHVHKRCQKAHKDARISTPTPTNNWESASGGIPITPVAQVTIQDNWNIPLIQIPKPIVVKPIDQLACSKCTILFNRPIGFKGNKGLCSDCRVTQTPASPKTQKVVSSKISHPKPQKVVNPSIPVNTLNSLKEAGVPHKEILANLHTDIDDWSSFTDQSGL